MKLAVDQVLRRYLTMRHNRMSVRCSLGHMDMPRLPRCSDGHEEFTKLCSLMRGVPQEAVDLLMVLHLGTDGVQLSVEPMQLSDGKVLLVEERCARSLTVAKAARRLGLTTKAAHTLLRDARLTVAENLARYR